MNSLIEITKNVFPKVVPLYEKVVATIKDLPKILAGLPAKIQEAVAGSLQNKDSSLKDYVKIGSRYVSKRLILRLLLIGLIGGTLAVKHPYIDNWFGQYELIHLQNGQTLKYTGKAKIFDSTNTLRYQGAMTDGLYNGSGKLFNAAGDLIYEGDFKKGKYDGTGILYDDNGNKVYSGQFVEGVYSGTGTLYYGTKQV
ncbi:MAG: hypothetical protein ACXVP5_08550, partial [Tumebacillaceae bacterium]